jgi:hypothetical protein
MQQQINLVWPNHVYIDLTILIPGEARFLLSCECHDMASGHISRAFKFSSLLFSATQGAAASKVVRSLKVIMQGLRFRLDSAHQLGKSSIQK